MNQEKEFTVKSKALTYPLTAPSEATNRLTQGINTL